MASEEAEKKRRYRTANPGYCERQREYHRKNNATNPERRKYLREYSRWYRATHPEYVQRERKHNREYMRGYSADPVNREVARQRSAAYHAFACAARSDLRSLMQMGPRTSKLIRSYIDIESASDGEVTRFYRKLVKELANGD